MESNLNDTVDLVPIAAYLGKGRRAGIYGSYLHVETNKEIYDKLSLKLVQDSQIKNYKKFIHNYKNTK